MEQIGCFKAYILFKKKSEFVGMPDILLLYCLTCFAMLLIPGDGKQIRVKCCCENFLLHIIFSLKHTLTI